MSCQNRTRAHPRKPDPDAARRRRRTRLTLKIVIGTLVTIRGLTTAATEADRPLATDVGYTSATIVFTPQGSWMAAPGRGIAKINASFAFGGPPKVAFMTVPVTGLGGEGDQSLVHLDSARGAQLWCQLADGNISAYLRRYRGT
jgi:hypothetical protein